MPSSILYWSSKRCFLIDSLVFSPSRFFHARAHQPCSSLVKYRQRLITLKYRELVKFLSVSPVFKRTVLILLKIHIFVANSRDTTNKIHRTTCRYSCDRCKRVSSWYKLFEQQVRVVACQMFKYLCRYSSPRTSDRDRSSNVTAVT